MSTTTKRLFVGLTVGVAAVSVCVYVALQIPKPAAAYSTAASILSALQALGTNRISISVPTDASRVLSGDECQSLVSVISKSGVIDYSQKDPKSGQLLDPWNAPYMIEVQKSDSGLFKFIVWSKGRDGISGTSDDIIAPYGTRPPKNSK